MSPIIVQVPKRMFAMMLAGLLAALLVPLDMLYSPLPGASVVALICFVFLVTCALVCAARLISSAPMLLIDDTGLTDNASAVSAGFLLWTDIERAEICQFWGTSFLSIHVVDKAALFARMPPLKRALMRLNVKLLGAGPVNLPLQVLGPDAEKVLAAIRAQLAAGTA